MKKLVIATNNAHKLEEIRQMLGDQFEVMGLADIGCHDDIPETAGTIEGNAEMKARYVKEHYGLDCFSDDTGLEIDALGGEPGVHSARYGGVAHDSERNIDKVLRLMANVPAERRTARFRTAIALLQGDELQKSKDLFSPSATVLVDSVTTAFSNPSKATDALSLRWMQARKTPSATGGEPLPNWSISY